MGSDVCVTPSFNQLHGLSIISGEGKGHTLCFYSFLRGTGKEEMEKIGLMANGREQC